MSIERKALNGFAWVVVLFLVAGAMSFFVLSQIDRMLKPHNLSADVSLHLNTLRLGQAVLFAFVLGVAYFKARQVGTGLRHASGQLEQLMAQLDSSATEFQGTAAQQASGAAEQAAAVTETTATMEELSRTAQQIAHAAEETLAAAEDGQNAVSQTMEGMDRIKERVDEVAGRILSLGEKSQRIGEINEIITDITGKTHLLALNAAIESAAAGEFGARFAVVAAQVKELADETREATGQVKAVIREIQNAINASVMATEETTKEVNRGAALSGASGKVIEEIVERVQGINVATQQQQTGSEQVVTTMRDIQEVARQSAGDSHTVKEGADRMAETASHLRDVIGQLTHDVSRKKR